MLLIVPSSPIALPVYLTSALPYGPAFSQSMDLLKVSWA